MSDPFNVVEQGAAGALADASGSIIAASVSQLALAASINGRRYLVIQNNSAGAIGFNFGAPATLGLGSLQLAAGQSFTMESSFISTDALNVIGATIGQLYTIKTA